MNRKTVIALVAFLAAAGAAYAVLRSPPKGQRQGERPRVFAPLFAKSVDKLVLTAKGHSIELVRQGKDWMLTKPLRYAADLPSVEAVLERLEKLEVGDLVTEQASRHAEQEVDDKQGVRAIAESGGKPLIDLVVGRVVGEYTMVRPTGKNQVYQAVGSLRFVFDKEVKHWRNRTIFQLKPEDARKIEVKAREGDATQQVVLARKDDKQAWKVQTSTLKIETLDSVVPTTLLSSFTGLTASDFADGKKLEEAGLKAPLFEISLTLTDGKPHTLLVGKTDKDNVYVKRGGDAQVYVLQKYTAENLMRRPIEFRDKTVLSFKAEDVVSLEVTQNKGGDKSSVKLTLAEGKWRGNGKDVKDPTKIKTAVETLATLKAEGFARHAAAEMGLDAPAWSVKISLKDKTQHQLNVGGTDKDGMFGLQRKGLDDIFVARKYMLERFQLEPANFK